MVKKSKTSKNEGPGYLVCVSTEKRSEAALHVACSFARRSNGYIILLHVIEPMDFQSIGIISDKIRKKQYDESQELLENIAKKTNDLFDITPVIMISEGLIEEQIIEAAEQDKNIKMVITQTPAGSAKNSKTIPALVASVGNKLGIPILVVPENCREI